MPCSQTLRFRWVNKLCVPFLVHLVQSWSKTDHEVNEQAHGTSKIATVVKTIMILDSFSIIHSFLLRTFIGFSVSAVTQIKVFKQMIWRHPFSFSGVAIVKTLWGNTQVDNRDSMMGSSKTYSFHCLEQLELSSSFEHQRTPHFIFINQKVKILQKTGLLSRSGSFLFSSNTNFFRNLVEYFEKTWLQTRYLQF